MHASDEGHLRIVKNIDLNKTRRYKMSPLYLANKKEVGKS